MSKPTRWQVVQTAASQIGYVEGGGSDGRSGNVTRYWQELYPQWQGQPWCGAFVAWVLRQRGVTDYPIGIPGIFYTPSIVAAAKSKGVWHGDSDLASIKPGDVVLFDFGSGGAVHVGLAEEYLGAGQVRTIEGNTSPTNRGSQNNGGGVYRRTRTAAAILGWVDMSAVLADSSAAKAEAAGMWRTKRLADHGVMSVATIKRLQAEVGTTVDGQLGKQTRAAVQRWLGVEADSVWGPVTIRAIQKLVGADRLTGRWTPWLVRALQRHLNALAKARR